jgi:hypothetical protein
VAAAIGHASPPPAASSYDFSADEAFCARELGWIERTSGKRASVSEPRRRIKGDPYCEHVALFRR